MKLTAFLVIVPILVVVAGCSADKPPTPEEKKAFMGGPMPKDFMKQHPVPGPATQGASSGAPASNSGAPATGG